MKRARIKAEAGDLIVQVFEALARWSERMAQRFSFCPDCGRNRYTGKACKK